MIIVDSTVWIDLLNGVHNSHTALLVQQIPVRRFGLTDLILAEVLRGARSEKNALRLKQDLSNYALFDGGGEQMAVASAHNYRLLRDQGFTVRGLTDCFIATFCLQHGYQLLHRDRDYEAFEKHLGLKVLHPALH
jgi:predicted nucleic acid-binding protein